jgi:septal ring-binding cell division protein DamX
MKKTIPIALAVIFLTGTGALAQAAMSPAPGATKATGSAAAPKADATDMKADAGSDAAAKPKARHHRMAKNEAALNAKEAETTKQLNQEQAQMASNSGGMSSTSSSGMNTGSAGAGTMSNDPNRPNSGMGRVQGANSGVEGRVGGTNSGNPAP